MTAIILGGAMAGLGVAMVVAWFVPSQPHLASALDRLDPSRTPSHAAAVTDGADLTDRLGVWLQRHLPTTLAKVPAADLAVLGISANRYLGQRAAFFLVGLLFPTLFTAMIAAFGWVLPFTIPVLAGIVFGTVLSLLPAYNAKSDAAVAREEFTRAVGAFTDLTALERQAGAGTTQALESASAVGDSWVFVRIREELAHARWAGKPPWDALSELGASLQVPGLADLGDIMRMSGEQGVAVYDSLRARAASNREAVLAADHARANRASEALTMPTAALGVIFLGLLATPAVIRIALG
jgi:Flp pilus assembly protein TadB